MMENDDKLLTSFFAEHRQEIADNGFSRRVLRHLPAYCDICPTVAATWRRYGQHSALLWPSYCSSPSTECS